MKKKIKMTSQEKGLCELFRRLGYGSKFSLLEILKYAQENNQLIKKVEPDYREGYPLQSSILFSHYKVYFANADEDYYNFKINKNFSDEDFIRQVKRSCRRISRIFDSEKYALKHFWINKNYILSVMYVLKKGAKVGIHNLIKPDDRSINYLAAIYLDKKNQRICIHHIPPKVLHYFNLILQEETEINFIPSILHKDVAWSSFPKKLFSSEKLELVEIGLNKTDFANGDQIIIKPKDKDVREYLKALLDQRKILNSDTFDISYIDYIKIRRKDEKYNLIKLNYNEEGIVPSILSTNKDNKLIKELESLDFPVGTKIVDTNYIPKKLLVQQLLMSSCISKDELKNRGYSDAIKYLESINLIKDKVDRNLYLCWKSKKCKGSFFLTKICPSCGNKRTIKVPNGMRFNFDIQKIKIDLKKELMKNSIKYRRLKRAFYDNKFELQKASINALPEINIYFNLTGLYESVLSNFRLCPLPLLVINFRGELKDDLKYIHQLNAADFLEILYDSDKNKLISLIKKTAEDTRYAEKKEIAFLDSLKKLREFKNKNILLVNSRKGNEFEWLTFNILSYIFLISAKWGGRSLPDGIIGFNKNNKKFAFWDAKRYDDTKLSNYAKKRKGGIGKDLKYILKSISQENTYEEGQLEYYIFVTSNTHKEDFIKVKEKLNQKIQKMKDRSNLFKRLREIKFCCINLEELIKLGALIEDKKSYKTLQRRCNEFEIAFEQLLNMNDGYLTSNEIEKIIAPLINEKSFLPDKTKHKTS